MREVNSKITTYKFGACRTIDRVWAKLVFFVLFFYQ